MAAVRHLGFLKFKFFNGQRVKRPILHHRTKLCKDQSKRWGRYCVFCDFQGGGRRQLRFSKIRNFNGRSIVRGQYASSCQVSSKSVKRLQRCGDLTVFFQNGGRPSWICWAHTGTTHDDYMVVSIVVQNFFEINMVVSITKLSILCPLGLKMPIHAPNLGFWGDFTPKW